MSDNDITAEEDALDVSDNTEQELESEVQSTTTDFSKITFFVDRTAQNDVITDEQVAENEEPTDSFDAVDVTDEESIDS